MSDDGVPHMVPDKPDWRMRRYEQIIVIICAMSAAVSLIVLYW